MSSVDGVEISEDLYIEDEYATPARLSSARKTMGGRLVIQEFNATPVEYIVVAGVKGKGGFWTKGQLDAIRLLEASGKVFTLVIENDSWQVKVAAGGIDVEPLYPRPNTDDTDIYFGTVTFIKV